MDLIIENLLGQAGGNFKGLIFGFVHVAIMIVGYYTGFSINKFLKILSNGYVAGIFGVVLSHIIADIIACYLDPDLRKMIFGVVIGLLALSRQWAFLLFPSYFFILFFLRSLIIYR